ncbi:hypothetical protein [Sphingobium sp.]|uniref:hypothetical protein n=1 Tax=Sphingobium sp. TaxID=1912891 RepID=UPI002C4F5B10|nr:hypothetical protein [Sphingobium sp.]HUD93699.1 hypothetical protein [Sphingobium sp.]
MGKKITRAEESARIAYRKGLAKAVRSIAKGTDWRTIEGCLFKQHSGWFVSATPSVHIFDKITTVSISAKPMEIDPIFWDMSGLPENQYAPLSFRLNGAWVCRPPAFNEIEISEHPDTDAVAKDILAVANSQLHAILTSWSLDDFVQHCKERGRSQTSYLPSIVAALVVSARHAEALNYCIEAIAKNEVGGFLAPDGTFAEMARDWLAAPRSSVS